MKDAFTNVFDSYTRVARLNPALLALAPMVWTAVTLNPSLITKGIVHMFMSAAVLLGGLTLLLSLARSRGKAVEAALLSAWGGWPTTALLRHRDPTIDSFTKARYHAQLQALCPELMLPTAAEEASNPRDADDKYRSATRRLLELRRDPQYKLLHKENAQYGFRRNLLGLKPIALVLGGLAMLLTLVIGVVGFSQPTPNTAGVFADVSRRWPIYVGAVADLSYLLVIALLVRAGFVRQAADEYAIALLRTLESS